MKQFSGKVILITGASSGIGAATAIAFSKEGAKLTICGRNKERLSETAKECIENGAEVLEIDEDLTEFEHLEPIVNKTVEKFSTIDILVNNAGCSVYRSIGDTKIEDFDKLFQILLRAPVFLSKYALPHLKKTKGCIVNVSSVAAMVSSPNGVPYKMFKGALDHFTKGFASVSGDGEKLALLCECSPFGVRVNSINPALVHTRILETFGLANDVLEKFIEKSEALHHFGVMQPETIADGIKFLCSSPHITGITLPVTSGFPV